jgi:hypothetical protein
VVTGQPLSAEEYGAKFLREGVAQRVRRLREMADRIESEAKQNIARAESGQGTYGRVVGSLVHEITWGIANLHLETLMSTATDADIAHAEAKS